MDIIELRKALTSRIPIEFKVHCLKRMLERGISRQEIFNCVLNGEIIEEYPLDESNKEETSFSMCFILKVDHQKNDAIHVVVGYNGK